MCYFWVLSNDGQTYSPPPYPPTDVALSSSLLCHDLSSPTQGCCSDGALLLGGFGGPLTPNLAVSSVEYLGPEEDHPSPGRRTFPHRAQRQQINGKPQSCEGNGYGGKMDRREAAVYEPQPQQIDYESVLDCCDQFDKVPCMR